LYSQKKDLSYGKIWWKSPPVDFLEL
jgi:hypothetical protein